MKKKQKLDVFSDLSPDDYAAIEDVITWSETPKNTILISYCETSSDVYFIASGKVRATTYSFTGKEVSYQELSPGEMFGELSAIDNKSRTTSIVTTKDSVIGKISSDDFWRILEDHPKAMRKVMIRLAGLVRYLASRVYEYSAMSVSDRVRAEIIRHGRDNMVDEHKAVIEKMPTHEILASQLATHREAVTKEFSYLQKKGVIEKVGKTVVVPNIGKLEDLISDDVLG